jgi:hypothetical protein
MTITFTRQLDVLTISQEEALEGYLYWYRVREGRVTTLKEPETYPDYVKARLAAIETLRKLALLEWFVGVDRAHAVLDRLLERAEAEHEELKRTAEPARSPPQEHDQQGRLL